MKNTIYRKYLDVNDIDVQTVYSMFYWSIFIYYSMTLYTWLLIPSIINHQCIVVCMIDDSSFHLSAIIYIHNILYFNENSLV